MNKLVSARGIYQSCRNLHKSVLPIISKKNLLGNWDKSYYRSFSSDGSSIVNALNNEIKHEESQYEEPSLVQSFLNNSPWTFSQKDGDINMRLTRVDNDKKITVEFQLVSPLDNDLTPNDEGNSQKEEYQEDMQPEMTDFCVTVEYPSNEGMSFYCTTLNNDEKFRFMIGNIRYFSSGEEKVSPSTYNGPDFEDLEDGLQAKFDEWLTSIGINEELCDFIDTMAIDKEQREYMRWLNSMSKLLSI